MFLFIVKKWTKGEHSWHFRSNYFVSGAILFLQVKKLDRMPTLSLKPWGQSKKKTCPVCHALPCGLSLLPHSVFLGSYILHIFLAAALKM